MQRLRRHLRIVAGRNAAYVLLVLMILSLPALSGALEPCLPNGDVDRDGSVTIADALLAFQHVWGLTNLEPV